MTYIAPEEQSLWDQAGDWLQDEILPDHMGDAVDANATKESARATASAIVAGVKEWQNEGEGDIFRGTGDIFLQDLAKCMEHLANKTLDSLPNREPPSSTQRGRVSMNLRGQDGEACEYFIKFTRADGSVAEFGATIYIRYAELGGSGVQPLFSAGNVTHVYSTAGFAQPDDRLRPTDDGDAHLPPAQYELPSGGKAGL